MQAADRLAEAERLMMVNWQPAAPPHCCAAGAATAATLYADGTINAVQATILFPATITMGTLIGHFVRCVVTAGTNPKHHPLIIAIPIIDAVLSMFLTRMIISVMGIS